MFVIAGRTDLQRVLVRAARMDRIVDRLNLRCIHGKRASIDLADWNGPPSVRHVQAVRFAQLGDRQLPVLRLLALFERPGEHFAL